MMPWKLDRAQDSWPGRLESRGQSVVMVRGRISFAALNVLAEELFGNRSKAVVDVERRVKVVGGEFHADEEALLLENGSRQQDPWGIKLYPESSD